MCRLEGLVSRYAAFFRQRLNLEPFRLTLYWARKFFGGQSFALTAPTGYGKTTFGITLAGFTPGKVCYIVPTRLLLNQVAERLNRVAGARRVLAVRSPRDRARLEAGDFDILVITGQFLHARFDLVAAHRLDLIFIDDTDSLVRRPRNVDKVLRLAGFTPEEVAAALRRPPGSSQPESRAAGKGQVIAASATLDLRSPRVRLFRELLRFEVGSTATFLRNIVDAFLPVDRADLLEVCADLIRRLGPGGFVFLNERWRREDLAAFVAGLRDRGINAVGYQKFSARAQAAFSRGEIEVAVGFSSVRNPLVRGIDLPEAVRYTLFVGVPALRIPLVVSYAPAPLFMVLLSLREVLQPYWPSPSALVQDLRFLRDLGPVAEERILGDPGLKARVEVIKGRLEAAFADQEFWQRLENHPAVVVRREETGPYLLVADARAYIQASGRCSRLFPLGLTRGLSVVLVEDGRVFDQLQRRLRTFGYEVRFEPLDRLDLPAPLREVDRDRQLVRQALAGEPLEVRDPVKTCLVVVESPTKARTIAGFFGRPSVQVYDAARVYEVSIGNYLINVVAILGHFTDLTTGVGTYGVEAADGEFVPVFQPIRVCQECERLVPPGAAVCLWCGGTQFQDRGPLVEALRRLAAGVDEVYIATDPDTEGEKIAWDLFCYLYPYNRNSRRMEMHEITRGEFLRRFNQPRGLDRGLIQAQLARRVADRWVGFALSEDLQRAFGNRNLSAGRVQTPVLGWLIAREEARRQKIFRVRAFVGGRPVDFFTPDRRLALTLRRAGPPPELAVSRSDIREEPVGPPPPYQTSDLLKDAWDLLRLDSTAMRLAQELFEEGLITYHRTDSYHVSKVSKTGRNLARELLSRLGAADLFEGRSWGPVGTHECIRPTRPLLPDDLVELALLRERPEPAQDQLRLYDLIVRRFLASQARPAVVKAAAVSAELVGTGLKAAFRQPVELVAPGYTRFFNNLTVFDLPDGTWEPERLEVQAVPREPPFNFATLVDAMKTRGLGRPSTYAVII